MDISGFFALKGKLNLKYHVTPLQHGSSAVNFWTRLRSGANSFCVCVSDISHWTPVDLHTWCDTWWPSGQAASCSAEMLSFRQKEKQRVCMPSKVLLQFLLQHSRTYHRQVPMHWQTPTDCLLVSVPLVTLSTNCGEGQSLVISFPVPTMILWNVAGKTVMLILGMEAGEAEKQCMGHLLKCLFWLTWADRMEVMRE